VCYVALPLVPPLCGWQKLGEGPVQALAYLAWPDTGCSLVPAFSCAEILIGRLFSSRTRKSRAAQAARLGALSRQIKSRTGERVG